jgi:hypothetical protein
LAFALQRVVFLILISLVWEWTPLRGASGIPVSTSFVSTVWFEGAFLRFSAALVSFL